MIAESWRPRPAQGVVALCALLGLLLPPTAIDIAGQRPYPASKPGAPNGVYSAPRIAIDSLRGLLREDSLDAGANWRLARALLTMGELAGDAGRAPTRDSLYQLGLRHARRAVRAAPESAQGHVLVASLLSRLTGEVPLREHVGMSREVLRAARTAVELDPANDAAWHALGDWHMEVRRLASVKRFLAVYFLDGGELKEASSEVGVRALERAVELRPHWIEYRLDLAKALVDLERFPEAAAQLDAIAELSEVAPEDARHVREAQALGRWMASGGNAFARTLAGFAPLADVKLPFLRR